MPDKLNPYEMLESQQSEDAIVHAAAHCSDEELRSLVTALHSQQITVLGARTGDRLRQMDVHALLEQGCLLHLLKVASTCPGHEPVFENVFADSGVCRTQGLRALAVWRRLGRVLIQEPRLQEFFVPEALKILAAESCPDPARAEALERGRGGELIRIKQAEALIRKHSAAQPAETRSKRRARAATGTSLFRKWAFAGMVVRVELKPTQPLGHNDLQSVISDLQAALAELQTLADRPLIDELDVA